MAGFALAVILGLGALVVAMSWSLDDLIFPTQAVPPPGPLPVGSERLVIEAPDGARLAGAHIPPAGTAMRPRTLVLGFGGNAWNGEDVASYVHELYPSAHVVAFHYRGYRPSTGSPSADALVTDAPLVLEAAIDRVKPERTIAVGFSIGSAIAASLARSGKVDGLVLVTPFDSLKAVASDLYPWVPGIGLVFRHELDTAAFLQGTAIPTAILSAAEDEIVPAERTDALRVQVRKLVFDRTIEGAGHNELYARSDFHRAMREALASITSTPPSDRRLP